MANKVNSKKIKEQNEMLRFIKMIIIVTLVFFVFYVLTIFINKDDETTDELNGNASSVSVQYDEILIGNIFKQTEKNYYVLIEDVDDVQIQVYEAYISNYLKKEDSKKVYYSTLNNLFNLKYNSTESNLVNDINSFKVNGTTLIEISKGKIVKTYESHEDIIDILKEISKVEEKES